MERLDYFLVSAQLSNYIKITDIDPSFMSDYSIPIIVFQFHSSIYGGRYWRLNNEFLDNTDSQELIKNMIKSKCAEYNDIKVRWEMIKMSTRGESKKFKIRKIKSLHNKLEVLERKIYQIQQSIDSNNYDKPSILDKQEKQLSLITKEIEVITQEQVKIAAILNKINWVKNGEKMSKYFFQLEKTKTKAALSRININGNIVDHSDLILKALKEFYQTLYRSNQILLDDEYLSNIKISQVSEEDKKILEEPISLQEVEIAVKQLACNKAPGLDGLTNNFHQKFFRQLKHTLHALMLKIVHDKELHMTAKEDIISLLEKPGKDQLFIQNFRPLSLLCTDYKIFAKIISNRLSIVMNELIHPDQTGFMKNRFIAQNLMDLNAVITVCEQEKIPATVTFVDFYKAYDMIEWKSLYKLLKVYNFGPNIISMIKICQTQITSQVANAGLLSDKINIQGGLRQGCPLSCQIFDLVVEVLAIKIHENKDIEDICVGSVKKSLAQYADDLWVVTKHSDYCYKAMLKELDSFGHFTGLRINYDKTEILCIGSLHNTDAMYYSGLPLVWSDGPIRVLGIQVTTAQNMASINYNEILEQVEMICKCWSQRSLTLLGRILIINTLIVPLFTYRMQVLESPNPAIIKKYHKIIIKFLWQGKRAKIAYKKLIQCYENQGLKLVDLSIKDVAIKAKWAQVSRNSTCMLNEIYTRIWNVEKNIFLGG